MDQRPDNVRGLAYRDDMERGQAWRRGTMGRDIDRFQTTSSRPRNGGFENYDTNRLDQGEDFDTNRASRGRRGAEQSPTRDFGEFVGKGPKGYRRSDARILEEVQEALSRDGSVDASEIDVSINNGEVTLTGTVASKQQKRDAEDCAEDVSGVTDVHNQLRVMKDESKTTNGKTRKPMTAGSQGETSRR